MTDSRGRSIHGAEQASPKYPAELPTQGKLRIGFDQQIFQRQRNGGISRYFRELIDGLQLYTSTESKTGIAWDNNLDIIHATYYGGSPYQRKAKRRLVTTLFDMIPERFPEHFRLMRWRSPHANKLKWLQASDKIVAISRASADDLSFDAPKLAGKVEVIHLGTRLDSITPEPTTQLCSEPFWLMVGKRGAYKNSRILIQALWRLRSSAACKEHRLVFAGGGKLTPDEKKLIGRLGLTQHVIQIGCSDARLKGLMHAADALLVPSIAEGFSLPLIEGLVSNAVVIASDLEAHREVAGRYAHLISPVNAGSWADALLHSSLGQLARPKAILQAECWEQMKAYYATERMVNEHLRAYQAITDVATKP